MFSYQDISSSHKTLGQPLISGFIIYKLDLVDNRDNDG